MRLCINVQKGVVHLQPTGSAPYCKDDPLYMFEGVSHLPGLSLWIVSLHIGEALRHGISLVFHGGGWRQDLRGQLAVPINILRGSVICNAQIEFSLEDQPGFNPTVNTMQWSVYSAADFMKLGITLQCA